MTTRKRCASVRRVLSGALGPRTEIVHWGRALGSPSVVLNYNLPVNTVVVYRLSSQRCAKIGLTQMRDPSGPLRQRHRSLAQSSFKEKARGLLDPLVRALAALGVSPFAVSILGVVFSVWAAVVVATGDFFSSAALLLVAGLCDVLDGSLARRRDQVTRFGAFFDSTFDRVSELAVFGGLVFYYAGRPLGPNVFYVVVVLIALGGAMLVSYTRARLEGLGYECKVGLLERPERMAILIAGLFLGRWLLGAALVVLAAGTVLTVAQRVHHAYKVTRDVDRPAPQL